jgi:hypothetical protein
MEAAMPGRAGSRPSSALLALALAFTIFGVREARAQVSTFATGLTSARSCAFDASGNLYVVLRYSTGKIVRCAPPSNAMTTWATGFSDAIEMVFDDAGYAYVADYGASKVWKVSPDGSTKTAFATVPAASSITRDIAGNLYVSEYNNQAIDKITLAGVKSTYVAAVGGSGDRLTMVSMDGDGTLYAGLLNPGTVYKIGPGGAPVSVFNTSMISCLGFEKDGNGFWYSSSYDGNQIFRISPTGAGAAFAGAYAVGAHLDGTLMASRFNYIGRPAIRGNLMYVPEYGNNDVRLIDLDLASPVAGSTWGRIKALYR